MKRYSLAAGIALAVVTVLGLSGPAAAGEQVPFRGTLDGDFTATLNPGPPPVATLEGTGTGYATQLGHFVYEFPHMVNFGTVPPTGIGTYTFTAANGDTLEAVFLGHSSPVEPGVVFVVEEAVILGGTGRFAGATGEFTIMRLVYQLAGETVGSFDGTISAPGVNNP